MLTEIISFPLFFRYTANKGTKETIRKHNARMKTIWDTEKAAAKETGVKVSTMWKFHDFSITQILREINFGDSRHI